MQIITLLFLLLKVYSSTQLPQGLVLDLVLDPKEERQVKDLSHIQKYMVMNCKEYDHEDNYRKVIFNKKEIISLCDHYLAIESFNVLNERFKAGEFNVDIEQPVENRDLRAGLWANAEFISLKERPEIAIATLLYLRLIKNQSLKWLKPLLKAQNILSADQRLLDWNLLNYQLALNAETPFERVVAALSSEALSKDDKQKIVSHVNQYLSEVRHGLDSKLSVIEKVKEELNVNTSIEEIGLHFSGDSYLTKFSFERVVTTAELSQYLQELKSLDITDLRKNHNHIIDTLIKKVSKFNQYWAFSDFQEPITKRMSGLNRTYQDLFQSIVFLLDYQEYSKVSESYGDIQVEVKNEFLKEWALVIRHNELNIEILINSEVKND